MYLTLNQDAGYVKLTANSQAPRIMKIFSFILGISQPSMPESAADCSLST